MLPLSTAHGACARPSSKVLLPAAVLREMDWQPARPAPQALQLHAIAAGIRVRVVEAGLAAALLPPHRAPAVLPLFATPHLAEKKARVDAVGARLLAG